jgi:hypothetical protein
MANTSNTKETARRQLQVGGHQIEVESRQANENTTEVTLRPSGGTPGDYLQRIEPGLNKFCERIQGELGGRAECRVQQQQQNRLALTVSGVPYEQVINSLSSLQGYLEDAFNQASGQQAKGASTSNTR